MVRQQFFLGDIGHVAGHDFSISTQSAVGVDHRVEDIEHQGRLRAAAQIMANSGANSEHGLAEKGASAAMPKNEVTLNEAKNGRRLRCVAWTVVFFALMSGVVATGMAPGDPPICHYDGRAFSVGSLIVMHGTQGRECRVDDSRGGATWFAVRVD